MKSSAILWLLHDMARVMRAERERQKGTVVPFPGRRAQPDQCGSKPAGAASRKHSKDDDE